MKKILIINLLILFGLFTIVECCAFYKLYNKYKNCILSYNKILERKTIIPMSYQKVTVANEKDLLSNLRPVEYRDKNKQPIILFGCSYTDGFGLNEDETFSRKLADYTNRTVFNRGKSGTGIPFFYYQLSNNKVINELPKNPEFIIFTLIPDHFPRLFRYRNFVLTGDHTLRYKIKNDKLVIDELKFKPLHSLFIGIVLEEYIAEKMYQESGNDNILFNKLFDESHKLIKEHFKNSKFVIIYYKSPIDTNSIEDKKVYDYIKKNKDIILIDIAKEIPNIQNNKEMWLTDNIHPSAKAWDLIIPIITKKLNIDTIHH